MAMLRQYFEKRGFLGGLDWDGLQDGDHETVYAAWQELPQRSRDSVGVDFQNVAGLATNQGVQIIIEEGNFQGTDLVPELVDHPSHSEKAFHVLLNHPRVFRVASQLPARADGATTISLSPFDDRRTSDEVISVLPPVDPIILPSGE